MTVIGSLSSFRELREMSPHKRACVDVTEVFQRRVWGDQTAQSAVNNIAFPRSGLLDRNGFRVACFALTLLSLFSVRGQSNKRRCTILPHRGVQCAHFLRNGWSEP